jgi:hypothetical protein
VKTYHVILPSGIGRGGIRAHHCCSICREAVMQKKPIVDISNKNGRDSEKTPKIESSMFLKASRTYMPP